MPQDVEITLHPLGKKLTINRGTPLKDLLNEYGIEFPCGGKGACGACRIKLLAGDLPMSSAEHNRLQKLGLGAPWRLACFCRAESNITLEVTQLDHIILADNSVFSFTPRQGYGIAIDLGTTTLVAQLVDLQNGQVIDSLTDVNPQAHFGADLIARIQACTEGHEKELQRLIRQKLGAMITDMLSRHPVDLKSVSIVGNTVMHHIFCGLSVQPLAVYPFDSPHLNAHFFTPEDLKWPLPGDTQICFHAAIGSFVGSDILAGIAATQMHEKEEWTILIDLGTNGEIVVGNKHRIVCASTAAGPAFEGAKISRGMRATTGAISSLEYHEGKFKAHVIGNTKARGICGSGLIDVIAILLEQNKIGPFGELLSGEEGVHLSDGVALSQQDIREFQLAKAALATGVRLLLNHLEIDYPDVAQVYIAGGFGNFLKLNHVIRTGLIECEEVKIRKMGNTALIGAKMFLFNHSDLSEKILSKTSHINLEGDPRFQDVYIEKMMLT